LYLVSLSSDYLILRLHKLKKLFDIDETKIRILWQHDLPGDPESEHLKNGGHDRFHKIVFVSNWQMQQYINHYMVLMV
jgi:hypothetical protein